MKFISIFISLLFITPSCSKQGTAPPNDDEPVYNDPADEIDDAETNDSICTNCIWLQNNCNGNWSIGFSSNNSIGGFQLNIDGTTVNGASGGEATASGFMISTSVTTILGFSLSVATIPAQGSGVLVDLDLSGVPTVISGIVI